MDRRHFMAWSSMAALLGTSEAQAATSASLFIKVAAELGVEPNADRDQSHAMQRLVDELAASGLPIVLPAGRYRFGGVKLSSQSSLFGVPGLSIMLAPPTQPAFECIGKEDVGLRGMVFVGTALIATDCRNVTVSDCRILSSDGDGFRCTGTGLYLANNRISACARSAISVEGDGMVTGNTISGAGQFGLRLGGPRRLGTMTVINNRIAGPAVGIGVSNAEDGYALISMNMITGAKNGGIRALNGEEIVGKDLTKGGSEAFRNLAIAANVSV